MELRKWDCLIIESNNIKWISKQLNKNIREREKIKDPLSVMLLHGHLFIEDCYKRRGISQGRWDNNHESIELFNISTNSSFLGFLLILEFLFSSSNPVFYFFLFYVFSILCHFIFFF